MPEQRKIVTAAPENSETPLDQVRGWVTPNSLFFVRNHFNPPALDPAAWRLRIDGCVERSIEWSFDDLLGLPERTVFATVECAGNGRSFLGPRVPGVPWGAGAVGHAEWTGVPLRLLLERCGLKAGALEVLFEGADQGTEPDHPEPMPFARSLPLPKALHPDTLLATRMNGELLNQAHGAPLRLFVPGWYGVASVKWLKRIEVLDKPFRGYFQTKKYTTQRDTEHGRITIIVGPMAVKSEIIRPKAGDLLGVGTNRVVGLAWAGEEAVAKVDVSTDGGRSWSKAELMGPQAAYSWTLWEYLWENAEPGTYSLLARTTSTGGRMQPMEYDALNLGYQIDFCRPIPVRVAAATRTYAEIGNLDALLFDINAYAEENVRMPLDVDAQYSAGGGI
ncbi:MAG: sulfite oxidase [Planctomycetes bacterium]|nr:sulfite oxidase [Planctomycetota bacterium]